MASREERRRYANAGKADYNYQQEFVEFPAIKQDIYRQVAERGIALDEWSSTVDAQEKDYKDQVKAQSDNYKNQILAFEKSDEVYRKNQKFIQGAYDRKVDQAQASYDEVVQGAYYETDAAERQFNLNTDKAILDSQNIDFGIDNLRNRQSSIDYNINKLENQDANFEFQAQNTRNVDANSRGQSNLDKTINLAENSRQQKELEQQKSLIDKQIVDAATNRVQRDREIDLTYKEQVASSMSNLLDNNLKSIADQGSARASGQRGATARRNVAGIIATSGVNGARLAQGILRSAEVRSLDKSKSAQAFKEQSDTLNTNSALTQLNINRKQETTGEIEEEFKLKDALIGYDTENKLNSIKTNQQNNKLDQKTLENDKSNVENDISTQYNQQELIASQLGFEAEQLDMTREQLGESILSAARNTKNTIKNLKRLAKQENDSAFYQRMARPKFAALPKPPMKIPPPRFPPVVKQAGSGPFLNASDSGYLDATRPEKGASGISKALQIGATALSVAAIPFTGGASMGVFGALQGISTSAALTGGATLLGGLGKSGLFD